MMTTALSVATLVGAGLFTGAAGAQAVAPAHTSPAKYVQCAYTPTPDRPAARPVTPPLSKAPVHTHARATVETNYGRMVFELREQGAPCAVHNFIHLARSGFYANSQCFRPTNNTRLGVLQCGNLIRQEEGGPGYQFPDEVDGSETYPRGTLAMGNQGPGTNGSEFFVVHSFANIKPNYTVLGKLISGFETLAAMVEAGIKDGQGSGPPAEPVVIYVIYVKGRWRN